MKTEPDSFAYPIAYDDNDVNMVYGGLTKRELFAAMAMQGLLSDNANRSDSIRAAAIDGEPASGATAVVAVAMADVLIDRLNKDID